MKKRYQKRNQKYKENLHIYNLQILLLFFFFFFALSLFFKIWQLAFFSAYLLFSVAKWPNPLLANKIFFYRGKVAWKATLASLRAISNFILERSRKRVDDCSSCGLLGHGSHASRRAGRHAGHGLAHGSSNMSPGMGKRQGKAGLWNAKPLCQRGNEERAK